VTERILALIGVGAAIDFKIEKKLSLSALDVAIDLAVGNQVEGDYLEFGVYQGGSFVHAYKRLTANENQYGIQNQARFFAFDAFAGLPTTGDDLRPSQYQTGAYAASEAQFLRTLKKSGVNLSRVRVVKKWYNELGNADKTEHDLTKAAIIYFDCDIYESTKAALTFVRDLLVDGSVMVFDDFYRHKASRAHGVRRAWEEFLAENPHIEPTTVHLYRRVAFAVNILGGPEGPDNS
jgi:hypothetical protein